MESSSGNVDPTEAKADELSAQSCSDVFCDHGMNWCAVLDQLMADSPSHSDHVGQNEQNPQNHDGNVDPTEAKADELSAQSCSDVFCDHGMNWCAVLDQLMADSPSHSDHVGQNEQNPQNHDGKNKATSENIREVMSRNMALTDAAKHLEGNVDPTEAKADELSAQSCSDVFCERESTFKYVGDLMAYSPSHSDDVGQNEQNLQKHDGKNKAKRNNITSENIREVISKNMALTDAAKHLEVSRSTLKRRLKELGIKYWPSSRKFKSLAAKKRRDMLDIRNSYPELLSLSPPDPKAVIHNEPLKKTNPFLSSYDSSFKCDISEGLNLDKATGKVNQTVMATESLVDGHRHDQEHMDGPSSTSLNTAEPEDCDETFIVKAEFNGYAVRFNLSLRSSIDQLKEEVGKRLKLEKDSFLITYLDEDLDKILICNDSDLHHAVSISRSLRTNVVRLSVRRKCI